MKLRFNKPEGKISRRELFSMLVPRYTVIPFIEPDICRGKQECGLCLSSCPQAAIKIEDEKVVIETTLCSGCGVCITSCPHSAIKYDGFSLEECSRQTDELLNAETTLDEQKIVLVTCQGCGTQTKDKTKVEFAGSLIKLEIPCLSMLSPWLILRAFASGARGMIIVSEPEKCLNGFDPHEVAENVLFIQDLFDAWKSGPERIKIIGDPGDSGADVNELSRITREILNSDKESQAISVPLTPDERPVLSKLIKEMNAKSGERDQEIISRGRAPFGMLSIHGSECSGCGICPAACPTDALTASHVEKNVAFRLTFKHEGCVACGKCVEICPEKCLHLERVLDLNKINGHQEGLFEDEFVTCTECGEIIGSLSTINRVQAILEGKGQTLQRQYDLCPKCRIQNQVGL